jgi:GxxExxY protein
LAQYASGSFKYVVLLYEDLSRSIIGAAIEVHRNLGPGYLESVYANYLAKELTALNIKFERQEPLEVIYKGEAMGKFRPDILVEKKIVVEIKAVTHFVHAHEAKAIHYLTATGMRLALLLNFGTQRLGIKRIVI